MQGNPKKDSDYYVGLDVVKRRNQAYGRAEDDSV